MPITLPLTNWSIKKALLAIDDSFLKARVRIIFILLFFALIKSAIVIVVAEYAHQPQQLPRAIVALLVYSILLKALLSFPAKVNLVAHIMVCAGILIIATNLFLYTHRLTLITLQFVFMVMLGSFYALGNRAGVMYSAIVLVPVLAFLVTDAETLRLTTMPHELASPGFEILTVMNFITIICAHYYFYKSFHDNSIEKETLNLQLQSSVAEAKKLAEARSQFLATMSHELRTPLNSVIGITELMQSDDQHQKENLSILRNSALDLLSLINNILDINKLDSGKLELETVSFNLHQHVNHICAALAIKANDKKLAFRFEPGQGIKNLMVISDPTRLSQILYNLIGNAIKFTHNGEVLVRMDLLKRNGKKCTVHFSVKDTGIGIHKDRQKVIFESFTQAEADTTRKYGGTGLGLSIVQQVLAMFNSTISLKSLPGEGSVFSFDIMFDEFVEESRQDAEAREDDSVFSDLKILVAEDNTINKLVLKKQLDTLKVHSVMVDDGMEAFEAFMKDDYDAVLLDLDMPGWSGYETTKRIRNHDDPSKSGTYLIAFTASVYEQKQILANGFNDFLYKPVSMKELREKLEKVAAKKANC